MNALARVQPLEVQRRGGGTPEVTWAQIAARAPGMVATMASYLDQLEVSARPSTVAAAELTLRFFAHRVSEADPNCTSVAAIGRAHIEDYKRWLVARRGKTGKPLATMTIRHRLSTVRTFFERIMEWDYDDAPARLFIYMSDLPALDEPLPRFLDDPTAAKFMAALAQDPNQRRRLMVELLARTGMRVGELSALQDDAMVRHGCSIVCASRSANCTTTATCPCSRCWSTSSSTTRRCAGAHVRDTSSSATTASPSTGAPSTATWRRSPNEPGWATSILTSCATPLATQSINRGMSLEAIAALLGHRSMDMTLTYARISDDTVADAYFKVTEAVEAQYYGHSTPAPSHQAPRAPSRPPATTVACSPMVTAPGPPSSTVPSRASVSAAASSRRGPQFLTILKRQRKHADERGQSERRQLFDGLIEGVADAQ